MSNDSQKGLIAAIVFAAVVLGGSIVFFAFQFKNSQMTDDQLAAKITTGIETYVAAQQAKYEAQQAAANAPKELNIDYTQYLDDDAVFGDPNAPVTIIEFSDYQCPYCRSFYNETLPQIVTNYVDTGKVKIVYRDLPLLDKHPGAMPSAIAANCARAQGGDEMYYKMHDAIFDGQNAVSLKKTVEITDESLKQYAIDLGLDTATFNTCFEEGNEAEEVQKDMADADAIGISATPSFLVNNYFIEGAEEFATFQEIIEKELSANGTK